MYFVVMYKTRRQDQPITSNEIINYTDKRMKSIEQFKVHDISCGIGDAL